MMTILEEIFAHTKEEVSRQKLDEPAFALSRRVETISPPLDFVAALRRPGSIPALIAEIKKASPSHGVLVQNFDPLGLARTYQRNGAAAISVLTEEKYFLGSLKILRQVADLQLGLPLLRKDFICDPYQLLQARANGADAVLLIAAYLQPDLLLDLHQQAIALGLTPLVEVHNRAELDIALGCSPHVVGINNRDLHNFQVSLATTFDLRPLVPPEVCLVAESGIHTREDVQSLGLAGVNAVLVGEALVTAADVAAQVRSLACL